MYMLLLLLQLYWVRACLAALCTTACCHPPPSQPLHKWVWCCCTTAYAVHSATIAAHGSRMHGVCFGAHELHMVAECTSYVNDAP